MVVKWGLAAMSTAVALAGCSKPFCGESFCLTDKPAEVSKHRGVDFDVYTVVYKGKRFGIYEGNHPNTIHDKDFGPIGPDMVPVGFVEGNLYGSENGFQVVLRTFNRRYPAYVAVSVESKNPNDVDELLSELRGKQSKEGY